MRCEEVFWRRRYPVTGRQAVIQFERSFTHIFLSLDIFFHSIRGAITRSQCHCFHFLLRFVSSLTSHLAEITSPTFHPSSHHGALLTLKTLGTEGRCRTAACLELNSTQLTRLLTHSLLTSMSTTINHCPFGAACSLASVSHRPQSDIK
ncbi:hypothetical protein Q8A67_023332 [Cirrhinus molitorella]|uniref:Uncharacterized protein n=1 Tax=Cirrhinus molitorella TaxID=172907 RepID=A0AA88NZQ9_9TELE|nr:hypothetical protein Q8A67_023332 [Cirrhinus molitorella]